MLYLIVFLLGSTVIVNAGMALLVLKMSAADRRAVRPFITSAAFVILWTIGVMITLFVSSNTILELGKILFLVSPLWVMYYLFVFIERFPVSAYANRALRRACLFVASGGSLYGLMYFNELLQTNGLSAGLQVGSWHYFVYSLLFVFFSAAVSTVCFVKIARLIGIKKAQMMYMYIGATLSSLAAFFTNLLLPLTGNTDYIWMGPVFTLLYVASYSFAISKYRLFDFRLFAARTIMYVLTIGMMLALYSLSIYFVKYMINIKMGLDINPDAFYVCMLIASMLLYPMFKTWFDSLTKFVFFRNDYDEQKLLDQVGAVLLRYRSQNEITSRVINLLKQSLKSSGAVFVDWEQPSYQQELLKDHDFGRSRIISIEDIEDDDRTIEWLRQKSYAIVMPIETNLNRIGWLLIAQRRSGKPYTRRDFHVLSVISDEVAIALENAIQYDHIKSFNITLNDNIRQATSELRRSNKRLRELDASKDEFISMASHQLRTPLTSIKGYISMLLDGDLGKLKPDQRRALEQAYDSSQRMVYLIADFLNLSRIQTGRFELELTDVSLAQVIGEEIDQLRQSALARNVDLLYDAPADFPLVRADETKLRQVMMNFIDNAIYYARAENGQILVLLERHRDEIVFAVKDNGIGVPAHEKKHLFNKFYRADNARKARPDGTGLGLYMAKKVVTAHGGRIIFASKEGEGSEFGFRLPLGK